MSISGITSSNFFQSLDSTSLESNFQTFKKDFQQLGQDLQSGNLSQAQADFAAMESPTQPVSSSSQSSSTSLSSAFQHLATDLQSGNLTAAQSDYSTIQQDLQQQSSSVQHHHHHHHAPSQSSDSQNPINSLFSELGQALQSGNLSAAQAAYTSLQQEFEQLTPGASSSTSNSTTSSSTSSANSLNITA